MNSIHYNKRKEKVEEKRKR